MVADKMATGFWKKRLLTGGKARHPINHVFQGSGDGPVELRGRNEQAVSAGHVITQLLHALRHAFFLQVGVVHGQVVQGRDFQAHALRHQVAGSMQSRQVKRLGAQTATNTHNF